MERLQKVIAYSGYTSRRKAEELIINNHVKVNGQIVNKLGSKISEKDIIEIDGKILEKETKEYYILNKPRGVVSTSNDDKKRKTVTDLIKTDKRIYPVGRLDYDTTGVLLLTNDGEFANILMHPSNKLEKVYIAKVKGIFTKEALDTIKQGIMIDDTKVFPLRIKIKKINQKNNTSMVQITIQEGKNHEVKRIFESVGYEVLKLKRERMAFFDLKDLQSGQWRKLTPKEVAKVYSLKKSQNKKP